mgnify:CR=1 FL=1
MKKVDYYILTQILIDDIHFSDGSCQPDILGGGAYTAAGMRIWSEHVGICSGIGPDFAEKYDSWFLENDIHVAGVLRDMPCTHSRLNYFADGEREEILMDGYGSHDLMQPMISEIPALYDQCKGMYLFKDCDEKFWTDAIKYLETRSMISVWEILGAAAVPENRDAISDYLQHVDLFSLNLTEGRRLSNKEQAIEVMRYVLGLGAKAVILRLGSKGSLVSDSKKIFHIPAAPGTVVDVTGGGNASTGGFLVGYCESGGDIVNAGICASVAASYVLQQFGLPLRIDDVMMHEAVKLARQMQAELVDVM